jgi:3'-5' exoribonuclease
VSPSIRELTAASTIESGFFAVAEARTHSRKDGNRFVRARLRDGTGSIDAVCWDNYEDAHRALVPGTVVKVRGGVGRAYGGEGLEITIQKVRPAREGEFDPLDFLPRSSRTVDALVSELRSLIATLPDPLRVVVWRALEPDLERFRTWPGAAEIHHAWVGGLLEHSLEVARVGEAICQVVDGACRDIVIAGALLHDVGKLDAYQVTATFLATDRGRLVGHVLTGYHRVQVACNEAGLAEDDALRLLHIVASHHGVAEYGAAREPMTPEAIVVHFADELSAQLMQIREAVAERSDPAARWTDKVKGLRRDVFVGDNGSRD